MKLKRRELKQLIESILLEGPKFGDEFGWDMLEDGKPWWVNSIAAQGSWDKHENVVHDQKARYEELLENFDDMVSPISGSVERGEPEIESRPGLFGRKKKKETGKVA